MTGQPIPLASRERSCNLCRTITVIRPGFRCDSLVEDNWNTGTSYSPKFVEPAVRIVADYRRDGDVSEWAAASAVGEKLGVSPHTARMVQEGSQRGRQ